MELLKLPGQLQAKLREQAEQESKAAVTTIHFQVTADEKRVIEAALQKSDRKRKGKALAELLAAAAGVEG